jgi:hypothetical protein
LSFATCALRPRYLVFLSACAAIALGAVNQARPVTKSKSPVEDRTGATSANQPLSLAARKPLPPLRTNPFAARVEQAPAAPSAPQPDSSPPGPQLPPMPYRFAGKVVYGGKSRVALTAGDRIYLVVEGDTVEGGYIVRRISPDKVTLVYTPLGIDQELADVAEANPPVPAAIAAPVRIAAEIAAAPLPSQAAPDENR